MDFYRFSGVTQDDLENTTITLRDVQAVLLSMFSAESILIGHSLESDLFALKVSQEAAKQYAAKLCWLVGYFYICIGTRWWAV